MLKHILLIVFGLFWWDKSMCKTMNFKEHEWAGFMSKMHIKQISLFICRLFSLIYMLKTTAKYYSHLKTLWFCLECNNILTSRNMLLYIGRKSLNKRRFLFDYLKELQQGRITKYMKPVESESIRELTKYYKRMRQLKQNETNNKLHILTLCFPFVALAHSSMSF